MPNTVDLFSKIQQANLYFANLMNEYADSFVYSLDRDEKINAKVNDLYELLEAIQYQMAKGLYYDNEVTKALYKKIDCLTPIDDTLIVVDSSLINPIISNISVIYGPPGKDGIGIPIGGTTGQFLAKKSDADYDTEWVNSPIHDAVTIGTANGLSLIGQQLSLGLSSDSTNGALSSIDWTTFNSKQNPITLTTTGTSGVSTLIGSTLNIPNYSTDLTGYVTLGTNQTITGAKIFSQPILTSAGGLTRLSLSASVGENGLLNPVIGSNLYLSATDGTVTIKPKNGYPSTYTTFNNNGTVTFSGNITAPAFIKTGGLSTQFLKADGSVDSASYGTGTVTSVSALTLGTVGTDLSSTVANSTTTPVITLNVPTASATNRGVLSSTDWTTFNSKQDTITLTTTGSSGASTFISNTLNIPNYTLSGLGGVPTTRQLTINGTAYDLSVDRSWSVGTVTSVGLSMPVAFSVANTPVTGAGTLAVTAVGTASQYIRGDGQLATLPTGAGGGSAVNYYLNGSIASSVAGYQQMDNSAVIGAGTDFNLVGNGLVAQFLTDVGNPNRLLIPGGAWNLEMFFSVSSAGGNQKFYVDLLKYNGTIFSLIATTSGNPEEITGGTATDLYLTSLAVPETVLLTTDRLAIRVYIVDNAVGRTVTLHTEDNNLCQIITTFAGGISALNGLTANTQYFAVGTSGTDFNISSLSDTHTFNLPDASATARGVITTGTQTIAGSKTFTGNNLFNDGTLYLKEGIGQSTQPGYTQIVTANNAFSFVTGASGTSATFIYSGANIYNLPSSSGTLALTSQLSSYVPTARTITINGTTQDLSVNRTYSVGTVTSVSALTLGTSGTDLNSTVANSTTTPVITLNVPTASALNRGALSSTDWTTFNSKEPAISSGTTLQYFRGDKTFQTLNTSIVPEVTNLYFTNTRAQNAITLTTLGTSGAATYLGGTLNIPNYAASSANRNEQAFTATLGQTVFSITYSVGYLDVYYNGSKLAPSEFTATNGTSFTLSFSCYANDIVNALSYVVSSPSTTSIPWFTLVSGYDSILDLPSIPTGDVMQYTYLGGAVYYRFIANDDSEDSFYGTYSGGVFSDLKATKKVTIL